MPLASRRPTNAPLNPEDPPTFNLAPSFVPRRPEVVPLYGKSVAQVAEVHTDRSKVVSSSLLGICQSSGHIPWAPVPSATASERVFTPIAPTQVYKAPFIAQSASVPRILLEVIQSRCDPLERLVKASPFGFVLVRRFSDVQH